MSRACLHRHRRLRACTIASLLLLAACGDARRPAAPMEELVIPPLDAGAASSTKTEAGAPAPPVASRAPSAGEEINARDPRFLSRSPRERAVVEAELKGLVRLAATVGPPGLGPQLDRRLAEAYCELGYVTNGADAVQARTNAIRHYLAILTGSAPYPPSDEVRYYLGLTYEQIGDLQNARQSYLDLIQHHPQSKLVPAAYFAFGEMFYAEAQSDPAKYPLAQQAYREVLKFPGNPLYEDAKRRLDSIKLP